MWKKWLQVKEAQVSYIPKELKRTKTSTLTLFPNGICNLLKKTDL